MGLGSVRTAPQQALAFSGVSHILLGGLGMQRAVSRAPHTEPECSLVLHLQQCPRVIHHVQPSSAGQRVPRGDRELQVCSGSAHRLTQMPSASESLRARASMRAVRQQAALKCCLLSRRCYSSPGSWVTEPRLKLPDTACRQA